jgi:hypothetical protein
LGGDGGDDKIEAARDGVFGHVQFRVIAMSHF